MHQLSSIDRLQITLHYTTNLTRQKAHQPTNVDVKIVSPSNPIDDILYSSHEGDGNKKRSSWSSSVFHRLEGAVSDVDDDNDNNDNLNDDPSHYEFIQSAIQSFRSLPIRKAIQSVTSAMMEC